ncbi:hypothetical protein SLEP1_g58344 [Rubroshorea leprosula]|uniref:Uncharacterized protein n=2 Tax=Rubroshorea leprosula TaxID=152421 RepID=A0AAV5MRT5_9ROSI|nr:hypothetical protein SLEP1_g58344 [Rubroshorea leprosula]
MSEGSALADSKSRPCLCSLFVVASLICGAYFISSALNSEEYKERVSRCKVINILQNAKSNKCMQQCRAPGSEALPKALPKGIVAETSNLEMRPLWSYPVENVNSKKSKSCWI